ncbi:MAG: hypothetical protein PGN23_08390 [Sphingomonas adhaesiva]|uniref:hypothetical protein n=1 Tax=Sphingomonas adhaesiva TaxID=28212 RepID=UPI002FFCB413
MTKTIVEDPYYSIVVDARQRLVVTTPRGLWDFAIAARFLVAQVAALDILPRYGCPLGQQVTLIDCSEWIVQPQQIATMMGGMLADPRLASRRIAILAPAPLLAMQARRVAGGQRFFADRAEALAWLLAPEDDQSP